MKIKEAILIAILLTVSIPLFAGCCNCRKFVPGYYQRMGMDNEIGKHGDYGINIFTNKALDRADKIWQMYADKYDNAFFYRKVNSVDTVYVWTYRQIKNDKYITMDFINPDGCVYSMTRKYPNSIKWLSDNKFSEFAVKTLFAIPNSYGSGTSPEFIYLSRQRYYNAFLWGGLPHPDEPQYVDTIPIDFMRNYMRDFNDYVRPFMNMHIRIADSINIKN